MELGQRGVDCLRHIMQRTANDCAIAAAAMVGEVSYDTAAERSPVPVGKRGLNPREIISILESVTGVTWRGPQFAWWCRIPRLNGLEHPFVVVIRRPWTLATQHCVAMYDGYVYDPACSCCCRMNEYERRCWRVVAIYRPAVAERLLAVRQFHIRQRAELLAVLRRRSRLCVSGD